MKDGAGGTPGHLLFIVCHVSMNLVIKLCFRKFYISYETANLNKATQLIPEE